MRPAFRCFWIAVLFAVCLSPLSLRAQEPSGPCKVDQTAPLAGLFLASNPAQPSKGITTKILCGGAGQTCCVGGTCNSGLACNANGICRTCGGSGNICCSGNTCSAGLVCTNGRCSAPTTACGGYNQTCCAGGTCNRADLACNPNTNQCIPCGYYGEYCCPYVPSCFEGTCKIPGTCQP